MGLGMIVILFYIIMIIFIGLFFIFSTFFFLIQQMDKSVTLAISSILISIFTAVIVSRYSFLKNREQEHYLALNRLIAEINDNYSRMETFEANYETARENWLAHESSEMTWIPNKKPSYGFSTKVYQYFPCAAFNNFMNRGYFLDITDLEKLEVIMELYSISINLSNTLQDYEVRISKIIQNRSPVAEEPPQDRYSLLTQGATADLRFEYNDDFDTSRRSIEDYCLLIERVFSEEKSKFKRKYEMSNINNLNGLTIKYWWNA